MSAERRADLTYAATLALCVLLLTLGGVLEHRVALLGTGDFSYIWAGPRTILDGRDPYDAVDWAASVAALGTEAFDDPPVYSYPPFVAIALIPIGALPLSIAAGLWTWAGLIAAALSLRTLLRAVAPAQPLVHGVSAGTLLLSQPAVVTLYSGQWSFWLLSALSVLAVALRRRRHVVAAFASLMLLAKPQFAVFMVGGLAWRAWRRGETRAAAFMLAVPAAIILISAAASAAWWMSWISQVPAERSRELHIATLAAAFTDTGPIAPAITIAVAILVATLAVIVDLRRAQTAGVWVALGLLVAPYARSYDHLLLLVPIVLACAAAGRAAGAAALAGAAILVPGAWLLFLVIGPARGSESATVIIPAAVFALAAITAARGPRIDATLDPPILR